MKSRKFIAWVFWALYSVAVLILAPASVGQVIPWLGYITMAYIGSQAAVDAVEKIKRAEG